ncbi:hypothetical protein BsWGS_04052 [Bradybaena similaris]
MAYIRCPGCSPRYSLPTEPSHPPPPDTFRNKLSEDEVNISGPGLLPGSSELRPDARHDARGDGKHVADVDGW